MKRIPPPDLRVIDRTIERIQQQLNHYSCNALAEAYYEVARKRVPDTDSFACRRYLYQYEEFCWHKGRCWFWNDCRRCTAARVAALRGFKQACIDAGRSL